MSMFGRTLDGPRLKPASGQARQLVVLCHGYGADGNDLIGLARHWQAALPDAAFASPHAPERCAMAGTGYQWFSLSRIDPQETLRGAEAAAPVLEQFLDAELAKLGLPPDKLALVGFSQGTMMALHVGLRRKAPPAAIVGFSGLLVAPERLPKLGAPAPPVLLAHGEADNVIPAGALLHAAASLGAAGLPVRWHLAPGMGHGIDEMGMALAEDFLRDAFRGRLAQHGPVACSYPR
jgi:phospholipase/carboxylesterase